MTNNKEILVQFPYDKIQNVKYDIDSIMQCGTLTVTLSEIQMYKPFFK
jgi:hypothetical protein